MENLQTINGCMYNLLYIQHNEAFNRDTYFYYDIKYPTFYNYQGTYFFVSPQILYNINTNIKSDVFDFKNGILEESTQFNEIAQENNTSTKLYKVFIDYDVTFNKNHILSTTLSMMGFDNGYEPLYNELYNYNIDLLTGNTLSLKDLFKVNVNYTKIITDYVKYKINQNKSSYYPDITIEIPSDQSFYITNDGVVIYFGLDQIAPADFGVPKFKLSFNKFGTYINLRFYCPDQRMFNSINR